MPLPIRILIQITCLAIFLNSGYVLAQEQYYFRQTQASFAQEKLKSGGGALSGDYALGPKNLQLRSQYTQFLLSPFYAQIEIYGGVFTWESNQSNGGGSFNSNGGWSFGAGYVWTPKKMEAWSFDINVSWRYQALKISVMDKRLASYRFSRSQSLSTRNEEIKTQFNAMKKWRNIKFGAGVDISFHKAFRKRLSIPEEGLSPLIPNITINQIGLFCEPKIQLIGPLSSHIDYQIQIRSALVLRDNNLNPVPIALAAGLKWQWGRLY